MEARANPNNHLEHFSSAVNQFRNRVIQILMFLLFRLTRRLVLTVQKFTWAVTGVERIRRDAARGLQFKQSAHVQEIFWKRKLLDHSVASPSNFITTHKGFRPPSCVLRPNVSLFCLTRREAVFVEVRESENVFRSRHSTALYQNQFRHAVHLITLPLASFHKMASDIGSPRMPVTWLSCTARSGATLLSQMMHRIPGMLVLSEPDAITTLGFLSRQQLIPVSEYKQLLASAVRLLCKPDERYSAVFLRARPCTTSLLAEVVPAFPKFRYIFLYRNSLRSLSSSVGLQQVDRGSKILSFIMDNGFLSTLLPFVRSYFYHHHVFLNEKKATGVNPRKLDSVGILTAAWAASISQCLELRYKGYNIGSILYEDFMTNPRRSLSFLLQRLDIRVEHLSAAAEALKVDFHKGVAHDVDHKHWLSAESRQGADNVLKAYGLPKLGERFEMPGLLKLE